MITKSHRNDFYIVLFIEFNRLSSRIYKGISMITFLETYNGRKG